MTANIIFYHDVPVHQLKDYDRILFSVRGHDRYWLTEQSARMHCCTHLNCSKCGSVCKKRPDKKCSDCRYLEMEDREWDGNPIYSEDLDHYFIDDAEVFEHCEESNCPPDSLRLRLCIPIYMREIEEDYWADDLPEEKYLEDVAPGIAVEVERLNEMIRDLKPVLSWIPSKYRTTLVLPPF